MTDHSRHQPHLNKRRRTRRQEEERRQVRAERRARRYEDKCALADALAEREEEKAEQQRRWDEANAYMYEIIAEDYLISRGRRPEGGEGVEDIDYWVDFDGSVHVAGPGWCGRYQREENQP